MSVTFKILPDRGLVYIRYDGASNAEESLRAFDAYARHPECRPGQKQLVDLSRVTSFDRDFAKLLELQARKADVFLAEGAQTLVVYFAPNALSYSMARLVERSWEQFDGVVSVIQQNEADVLALLGEPEKSLAELLESAS